jgi:predicted amidohydrolase YtcJ
LFDGIVSTIVIWRVEMQTPGTTSRVAVLLFVSILGACSPDGRGADLVLRGGRIYTADPSRRWAEALAVQAGILCAVGKSSEMDGFTGKNTVVIELDGRLVLPGFTDCNVDLLKGSTDLGKALLDEAASIRDVQDIVLAYAKSHTETLWILGTGLQLSRLERAPSRHDLDEVVPNRPVLLEAHDRRAAWANSRALLLAGLAPETNGYLIGTALTRVQRAIPQPSRDELLETLRRGVAYVNRFGITAIHVDVGEPAEHRYELLEDLRERGEMTVRVDAVFTHLERSSEAELGSIERLGSRAENTWLDLGGVRVELDGRIESHSAALLEPYNDEPSTAGDTTLTQDALNGLIERLSHHSVPIIIDADGDRAVRMALDAYAKLKDTPNRRHRVEGLAIISRSDIHRLASLGAVACLQPHRASFDYVSFWSGYIDPLRLRSALPFKSLETSGTRLAFASRWPAFSLDPMLGIHAAVNRQNLDGEPERGWNSRERLSLEEALTAYAKGGAYCGFDEGARGSLEEGKLADLVVWSEDLFRIPARRIAEVEAVMTIVGGQTVYLAAGLVPRETEDLLLHRNYDNR